MEVDNMEEVEVVGTRGAAEAGRRQYVVGRHRQPRRLQARPSIESQEGQQGPERREEVGGAPGEERRSPRQQFMVERQGEAR